MNLSDVFREISIFISTKQYNKLSKFIGEQKELLWPRIDYSTDTIVQIIDNILKEEIMNTREDSKKFVNAERTNDRIKTALNKYLEEKERYFCLNCNQEIFFEDDSNYITSCDNCNWRNELNDTPAVSPIILKSKDLNDYTVIQICYPLIDKDLLKYLPDQLQQDVVAFLKNENYTSDNYQNIYHNIYKKDPAKMRQKVKELKARIIFTEFFHNTIFLKHK